MATASVTYTFTALTKAQAAQVNQNFTNLTTFLNSDVVHADGSVSMTGALTLPNSDPTNANHAARKSYVDAQLPSGLILVYSAAAAPTGWLLCDGSNVSRSTYAALFAVIGTTYGAGDGSTTFGLPNLKGRVVVGRDAAQTEFDALAETGGAKTHTLTTAELASHSHSDGTLAAASAGAHTHAIQTQGTASSAAHNHAEAGVISQAGTGFVGSTPGATDSSGAHTHDVTGSTGSAGSGSAHNNLQPYLVLNYIIKV